MLKTKRKNNLILVGLIALALCFSAVAVSLIHSTFFAVHANPVVEIVRNGSRISSKVEGISSPSYQWFMADATDGVVVGTFTKIESAAEPYLDLTSAQSNKAIKLVVSGNESNVIADIANVVVFDLAKGNVTFGTNYSGKDKDDNDLSAVHDKENIYIVQQSNNTTPTTHSIIVDSGTYDITIDGVNIGGLTPVQKTPGGGGIGNNSSAFIDIVSNQAKDVTLRIKGENSVRYLYYSAKRGANSHLTITDINGDGKSNGGQLYVPYKININDPANIELSEDGETIIDEPELTAFMHKDTKSLNHWNTAIGGDDGSYDEVTNFTIAGGYIQALSNYQDNCTAIGAGGNGYADIKITGGTVVAMCKGTGAAIGGGIGWNSQGGNAKVEISGGKTYAYNLGRNTEKKDNVEYTVGGVAIGAGSSFFSSGNTSPAEIKITGGEVVAYGAFGNGIGGGNSSSSFGGIANITIYGGKVKATSIGGGDSQTGTGGNATVTIDGASADVTISGGIGGGKSSNGDGGSAEVTVTDGTLNCDGVIGGGAGGASGNGGAAQVTVEGGTLTAKSIGGGTGGTSGNGGAAIVTVSGGDIETGSIGGGSTLNSSGKLGYASANISGGKIQGQFIMAEGGTQKCTFTMTGGTLSGVNTADSSKYEYVSQNGGAIYMDDPSGVVDISGGSITDCSAQNGGAVYMTKGTCTISGDAVIKNCSAVENGGAIYLGGGELIVSGGSISTCSAQNGGAAYINGGDVTVSGGEIVSNTAQNNGGGVAINNGNYSMSAGNVDNNKAVNGNGGAVYISSSKKAVTAEVTGGSVSNNTANVAGGAIAVEGQEGLTEEIIVTIGVNVEHTITGTKVSADHDAKNGPEENNCPKVVNNKAGEKGGALFVSGGDNTKLNIYCLVEEGSKASDSDSRSDFMKVEGGTVVLSTSENHNENDHNFTHGYMEIHNSIQVTGGKVDLYGSMNNPKITAPITVDIVQEGDHYQDHRVHPDSEDYYKLVYFENFKEPSSGVVTGQYTVYQIKKGDVVEISGVIYSHPGYEIVGWFTEPDGEGTKYEVGGKYLFDKEGTDASAFTGLVSSDLTIYAIWKSHYYVVQFDPNVPVGATYEGEMSNFIMNYDKADELPLNQYVYKGYLFKGWYDTLNDKTYADGQSVINLTGVDGKVVVLKAIWEICPHNDSSLYSYSASDNVLTLNCKCQGYYNTATVKANNSVYDGNSHGATGTYYEESSNGLYPTATPWTHTIKYEGTSCGDEDYDSNDAPINAGEYTASITFGGETAKIDYIIDKAQQSAPGKPTYTTQVDASGNITKVTIFYNSADEANKSKIEYCLAYYSGENLVYIWQTSNEIVPTVVFTNYVVMVRFKGDDNHYDSPEARANTTFYYDTDVLIHVDICDGFTHRFEKQTGGLDVIIDVWDGYYKSQDFNIIIETKKTVGTTTLVVTDGGAKINEIYSEKPYISDIPASTTDGAVYDIYVTITGAKKKTSVIAGVEAGEVFGSLVNNDNAQITRESAYSVYFSVTNFSSNYNNLSIAFNKSLPQKTSLILVDMTNRTYWYYVMSSATNKISLGEFMKMGVGASEKFNANLENLNLQFIIDFADVESEFNFDSIYTTLSADKTDAQAASFVDVSPRVRIQLKDKAEFSVAVASDSPQDSLQVKLDVKYAYSESGALSSKWQNRKGALVLTTTDQLPADVSIEAVEPNRTIVVLRNESNEFIVPISIFGSGSLILNLCSNMFPTEEVTYTFTVKLVASYSISGGAASNGEIMSTFGSLTFKKSASAIPSVKISQTDSPTEMENRVFKTGDVISIKVEMENVEAVTISLMMKNEKGEYNSTGWTQKTISASDENNTLQISLAGQIDGSYCILATVKNEAGETTLSVPYYFVIKN